MENRALGKGLSALIPEKTEALPSETVRYLKTSEIKENTFQPRRLFDKEKLADLVLSIKEKGVIQPILVRKKEDTYELIAGERRLRAAREIRLDKIPVIVKSVSDQEALVLALIENIQREELNAIEEANAFKQLIENFSFTQDQVAQSVGKSRSTITNFLRLLRLPDEIQKGIQEGILSVGHARVLLSIEDRKTQQKLFAKTVEKRLSVRELENQINGYLTGIHRRKKQLVSREQDIYLSSIEEQLQKILGTKVRIKAKKKRGKIVIEYYSSEDLERVVKIIKSR